MRKVTRKPLIALATLAALAVLAGAFPGSATSALNPKSETPTSEESNAPVNGRALFEQELAAKRTISTVATMSSRATREVDLDLVMDSLPDSAKKSTRTRQQLLEGLDKSGFKAKIPAKFRDMRKIKTVRNLDLPPKPRVINGEDIAISDTPYQVALVFSNSSKNLYEGFYCGGSIIGSNWILTAAHCVDFLTAKDLLVVSGIQTLPEGPAPKGTTASVVKSIIIHPLWEDFRLHDVALLELSKPLKFGANVQPINLADSIPTTGDALVSGWGIMTDEERPGGFTPQKLQGGLTPIVACPEDYYFIDDGDGNPIFDASILVCAGSSTDTSRADACYGDSGGPLVKENELIGVVSFGPDCPPPGIGGYASVNYFSDWIMCHAAIPNPFGGPYFCGDEAYWITVADTLKVAKGTWGGSTATFQWFADSQPIRGQTKSSLPLKGLFGKRISVRISSAGISQDYNFSSYEYGADEIHDPVQMGLDVKYYPSGDFVPCTAVNYQPWQDQVAVNKGSCSGTKGQNDGALQSSAGIFPISPSSGTQAGFWAYRDVALPANTVKWGWAILDPWSRGELITGLPGTDDFIKTFGWNDDNFDYLADFGAPFWGTYGTSNPLVFDDHRSTFWYTPFFPLGVQPPFEQDEDGYDIIPSYYFGPLFDYRYDEYDEPILDEYGDPVNAFSTVTVKGKGRVVMGTFGSDLMGSRLTFELGLVMAYYK